MADSVDKDATEEEKAEKDEVADGPVSGESEEDKPGAQADPAGGTKGEPSNEDGAVDGAVETSDEDSGDPAEGGETVTDDVWDEAMKEAEAGGEGAAPEVAPQSSEEAGALADTPQPADFTELTGGGTGTLADMDMILDIPVTVSVELGQSEMMIKDILRLGQGSVVELEKMAGEPMEILVNGRLVARGEVVMVNEKFGVRLTDIISPTERVKRLA